MIELSIGWVLALIGYGALATGIALAAICYSSKQRTVTCDPESGAGISSDTDGGAGTGSDTDVSPTVEDLKGRLRYMAGEYVKIQNEYAWFRNMVRQADPASYLAAVRSIEVQKRSAEEKRRAG